MRPPAPTTTHRTGSALIVTIPNVSGLEAWDNHEIDLADLV
jgi:hypothetical protein